MKPAFSTTVLGLALAGILATGPVMADKGGKHERGDQRNERSDDRHGDGRKSKDDHDRQSPEKNRHFEERQQVMVREYYVEHYPDARRCPPGLAKKHNGCMPPGQAKKWKVGHPLPREVIFYDVPPPLVIRIGPPPSGHRYVRVAGDILMIAIGTRMVVDAINDLGRM